MSLVSQIEATTKKYHDKELADCLSEKNYFYAKLMANAKEFADGRSYTWPVRFARHSTQWLAEYQEQDTAPVEQITQAEVDYVFSSTPCVLSEQELRKNQGKERILNLLSQKLSMLKDDVGHDLATQLISGDGVKEPLGLEYWVQETPATGIGGAGTYTTIAGIDRSTATGPANTWWLNNAKDQSAAFADAALSELAAFVDNCTRGNERPTLLLTDKTTYGYVYANAGSFQRFPHKEAQKMGFASLDFNGIPITWSDELTVADQRIYALNLKDWELNFMKGSKMHRTEWMKPEKQRAIVCYMYNDLAFLCKNPRNQGVLFDVEGA